MIGTWTIATRAGAQSGRLMRSPDGRIWRNASHAESTDVPHCHSIFRIVGVNERSPSCRSSHPSMNALLFA